MKIIGWAKRRSAGLAGLVILGVVAGIASLPLAPYDPHARVGAPFQPPSGRHWLGTNDIGQDIFSEVVYGARTSLVTGVLSAALALALGLAVGGTAGYAGGAFDAFLMRTVDVVLAVPFLPLVIVLAAYVGPSRTNVILVFGTLGWARPARVLRSQVLVVRNLPFVEAARALGASSAHIFRRHLFPAVFPLAIAQFVNLASSAILIESSLAFLGLGDPTLKSWGTMLYYAYMRGAFLTGAWWWVVPPGALIAASVLGFALLGYTLEKDPRS